MPEIGKQSEIVARFWESQPMLFTGELFPGFSPTCGIGKVDWQSESAQKTYNFLHRLGWATVFTEIGIWLSVFIINRKAKPVISPLQFLLATAFACIIGLVVLAYLGPSASCPQLVGVIVENLTPNWLTISLALASIGIGVMGIATRFSN
ncbi:MAG: hypothetical protein HYZ49_18385 [Chloroflexi bacterium]|nr:hypothetical protein [Chloroflexota bacterium]